MTGSGADLQEPQECVERQWGVACGGHGAGSHSTGAQDAT